MRLELTPVSSANDSCLYIYIYIEREREKERVYFFVSNY